MISNAHGANVGAGLAHCCQEAEADALRAHNARLEKVATKAKDLLWVFECCCDEAYTSRGLHAPNAICGEGVDLLAALAELEAGVTTVGGDG